MPKSKRSSLVHPHICAESQPAPAENIWQHPGPLVLPWWPLLGAAVLGEALPWWEEGLFWSCVYIWKNLVCQIFLHMLWILESDLSKAGTSTWPSWGIGGCVLRAEILNTGRRAGTSGTVNAFLLCWAQLCLSTKVENFIGKSECNVDIISGFLPGIVQISVVEATFTWLHIGCTLLLVTSVFSLFYEEKL